MKIVISFLMFLMITSCSYFKINSAKIKVQENVFVEGSRDIALLSAMHKINEDNIGFDSNVGSISSVIYSFENNPQDLLEFYLSTLNQLGWKLLDKKIEKNNLSKLNFQRDKENLSLEITPAQINASDTQKKFEVDKTYNTIKFFFSSSL
ncbi:MAG: hypothetical protein ACKO47_04160 [Alphaproteobacteria bacterium]